MTVCRIPSRRRAAPAGSSPQYLVSGTPLVSLLDLHLHRWAKILRGAWRNDEIPTRLFCVRRDPLSYRAHRVDNGSARWIAHEARQRLQRSAATWILCQSQDVRLLRVQSRYRCLQDLDQTLIEKRDGGRGSAVRSGERQMRGLPDCIHRLQIVASFAIEDRIGNIR